MNNQTCDYASKVERVVHDEVTNNANRIISIFVNLSAFHDEFDIFEYCDVIQRISLDGDYISVLACFYTAY